MAQNEFERLLHRKQMRQAIENVRGGMRSHFVVLSGLPPHEDEESIRIYNEELSLAKEQLGVTAEEWEGWHKDWELYLMEDKLIGRVISIKDGQAKLEIFTWSNGIRTFEVNSFPKTASDIKKEDYFEARVRLGCKETKEVSEWLEWKPRPPLREDDGVWDEFPSAKECVAMEQKELKREELEKEVEGIYTVLAESEPEKVKADLEFHESIKQTVRSLCAFARDTESRADYKWATEKMLHLEAILSGRFNTLSGVTTPFPEKELV